MKAIFALPSPKLSSLFINVDSSIAYNTQLTTYIVMNVVHICMQICVSSMLVIVVNFAVHG